MQDSTQTQSIETSSAPVTAQVNPVQINQPVVNNQPVSGQDWRSSLPEDIRNDPVLQKYDKPEAAYKSLVHAERLLGARVQELAQNDFQTFLGKLGRPESADKYEFPAEISSAAQPIKELAFKLGLNQMQAKGIADQIIMNSREQQQAAMKQAEETAKAWEQETKNIFGQAYNERVATADRAIKELGGEKVSNFLKEVGLDKHPTMLEFMAKIGKEFLEAGRVVQGDAPKYFGLTPQEADLRLSERYKDPAFLQAWNDPSHARHATVLKELQDLHAAKAASSQTLR